MEPYEFTIAQASARIAARELSPVALMESVLGRIEKLEPALKAWVTLDPDAALMAARESERRLEASGPVGPLHGIPVGVKDIFYTAGVRTTACSRVYAEFVPTYDATSVARFKEAGAIMLGKAVTTEFAYGDPSPAVNPWNAAHTPGGSSSGSAVAVASRMCPAALGSQTVGSVLRPAAYNGVVGLKPTYGRISLYGVFPLAWSLDTVGVLVRCVEDAALMLGAMAGHDPMDPVSSTLPVPDYCAAMKNLSQPPRIGLVRGPYHDYAVEEVRAHTAQVVEKLAAAGAVIAEKQAPDSFAANEEAMAVTVPAEAAAFHRDTFTPDPSRYGPILRATLEEGLKRSAVDYLQAQRTRVVFRAELADLMRDVDVLLTPSTPAAAPADLSTTGDRRFQGPWTSAGIPAITLPTGLDSHGMPMGVQLASPWFTEERLLAVAHWCEEVLGVSLTPPVG
jgi:aspartyl-tRNA(Asn)/glutamyl-tRNA(Gln) amidotransferase subunit A